MKTLNLYQARANFSRLVDEAANGSDPFDRLLIAQALFEPLILLTADKKFSRYSKQIRLV
jgi:PIN domain nuclease of toxin-antitoxin system